MNMKKILEMKAKREDARLKAMAVLIGRRAKESRILKTYMGSHSYSKFP